MKKFLCILLVVVLYAMSLGASAAIQSLTNDNPDSEQATDTATQGYGNLFEFGSMIGAYCNEWNKTIGKALGSDLYYDVSKITIIEQTDDSIVADVDGIIYDMDTSFNIRAMRVNTEISTDPYPIIARINAIIALLCYDTPESSDDMVSIFSDAFDKYVDALESVEILPTFKNNGYEWTVIQGSKKSIAVYFRLVDGDLYFSVE